MSESKPTASVPHDNALETALAWHRQNRGAVLAIVLQTWGSAPRPVGAVLAVSGASEIEGSVSGGCVEGIVVTEALESLADGTVRYLQFGVSDQDAFAAGLACGGDIRIMITPIATGKGMPACILEQLVCTRAAREPIILAISEEESPSYRLLRPGKSDTLDEKFDAAFRSGRSGFVEADGQNWFLAVHVPPPRLAIIGGAHTAQHLVSMARMTGFDVTLIDPRDAFASPERFPGTRILHSWPDEALQEHGLDARVAVATLSHDPKIDDPAIIQTLASDAFYLGCLGSTKTHAKRILRLREQGIHDTAMARIHAPIGLDIGARTPAEIAVSILAEITASLRGKTQRRRIP